ncbi:MAG TPA: 5'/3'-nucleotidase SurE [Polyangia bacterium]|jgi:5'-nucleotidase
MSSSRLLILVSNDDGIHAAGLNRLAERLAEVGDVQVVAPDRERSATSHAISLDTPLRVTEVRPGWHAVSGTPVDCIYLGVLHLLPRRPDLVISGVNHGVNLGSDIFYSGTVAAAVEGAIRGVPAFAISRDGEVADFEAAAEFACALSRAVLDEGLPPHTLLNVNVPKGPPRGYCWTRLGRRVYREQVDSRVDLRGRSYYWIGGPALPDATEAPGTDCAAVVDGLISVTPLDLDLTCRDLREILPLWRVNGYPALEPGAPGGEPGA